MITTTTTQQIRPKRTKISAILTCYSKNAEGGIAGQDKALEAWSQKANKIIVVGLNVSPAIDDKGEASGYDFVPSKDSNPSIIEVIDYYIKRGGPDEVVIIAAPNLLISNEQEHIFKHVEDAALQRAWAGYIYADGMPLSTAPDAFIVSGYVMQYVAKDIPDTLTFTNNTWAKWMHEWFLKHLQPNRYFNATSLHLARALPKETPDEVIQPVVIVQDAPSAPVLPRQEALKPQKDTQVASGEQKPVKRPRGRPKGWRKHPTPEPMRVAIP